MNLHRPPPCRSCPLNRRQFVACTSAAAAGLLGTFANPSASLAAESAPNRPTRIRLVCALHARQQPGPDWPNKGYDFQPVIQRYQAELTARCPGFEFVVSDATGAEPAKALLAADKTEDRIDGYLVLQFNCWNQVVQTLATSGKPVLYADFQFGGSGGFLVYTAAFLRNQTRNVGFVASSDLADLAAAVQCFATVRREGDPLQFARLTAEVRRRRTPAADTTAPIADELRCLPTSECLQRMKESRLLAVRDQTTGTEPPVAGITVDRVPFSELNAAWEAADRDEARAVADRWQNTAAKIEGVSRATLEASAAMYLAEKTLLLKHHAVGITINCLGGFYGGHIKAYPCLGFHQLLNDGLVGGCECDVRSAATLVIGNLLTRGRPGYISDPVIDTSRHQIIYAHCVAANRAFGPGGPANPFEILTHSEDRQGASIRSRLPTGQLTTSLQFDPSRKEILLHRARAVANDPDDRACRTKLCAEPLGDFEKLFTEWDHWGWHRVTFYGDLAEPVRALADALAWKVVEET